MKSLITSLIFSVAFSLFLTGCKKSDDPAAQKTKTELITTGTWKFSKAMLGSIDVSGAIQTCQKDNILAFLATGNGSVDEGLTKCNVGDPQSTSFTWNFASSESVLHVSAVFFSGGSNDFNIVDLSATQLVGSQVINGQTIVVTFIH